MDGAPISSSGSKLDIVILVALEWLRAATPPLARRGWCTIRQ
jgi:hypothetical protein